MKPFVLYEVGGVQGDIISDDTHTFSVNDDLIDEVEIIQSDDSIEGVKIYLKEPLVVDRNVLSQITPKVQHFFVNLYGKFQPTIFKFKMCIKQIYNPNFPDGAQFELRDGICISESITIISQHKIDAFKELFILKCSYPEADNYYMLFFNIMKIDNIVTRYLMQYELLLNLVAPNHRQKDITTYIREVYNPSIAFNKIGFHATRKKDKNYEEDDITYEYWLDTYMKDTVKQSTYASYRSYLNKHFCVLGKILLKKLEPHTLQEFYNYKFREEGLSPKTLRNYHMALHKCLQQAVKERLLVYNPCDAVTLPSGEKPEIVVFSNDQQRVLVQASYRHRYGVFIRLDLCTGLHMGELLALKWEDIDFSTAQLHVRRTINRLAKYEAHDGENKTEIVFGTPKTKNSRRTIPLTRTMADELTRWKQQQAQDKIRAGDKYTDEGFIVTNEFGHYFEQKTFKDYYDRLLKDADIGHFTFHVLRHTFATRALERGMDYKTLSAILGHYSVAFTMDTYVHSMDEHKRREMDKMDDMFGMQYGISVEKQPYPVLCTLSADGYTAHVPDFPKIEVRAPTLDAALLEVKQQIQKALRQYKNPPIPTKQEQIVVPTNSVLVLVKAE